MSVESLKSREPKRVNIVGVPSISILKTTTMNRSSETEITDFHFIIMFGRRRYHVKDVALRNAHIAVLKHVVDDERKASAAYINSGDKDTNEYAWKHYGALRRFETAGYVTGLEAVMKKLSLIKRGKGNAAAQLNLQEIEKFIDDELFDINSHLEGELPFYGIDVDDSDFNRVPASWEVDVDTTHIVLDKFDEEEKRK